MNINRTLIIMIGMTFLFAHASTAQEDQSQKKQKKEIIIRGGPDSAQKMIVIVNGDKVTVNGKEVNVEERNDFIIRRKKSGTEWPDVFMMQEMPDMFSEDGNEDSARTSLGVLAGKDEEGAVVLEVLPGTAADKAGLKQNDVIVSVSGKTISGPQELSELIQSKRPADKVEIQYMRDGKSNSTVASLESSKRVSMPFRMENFGPMNRRIFKEDVMNGEMDENLVFRNKAQGGRRLGLEIQDTEDEKGVKVIGVETGSAAEKSGFKNGDIIMSIDQQKISSIDDARSAIVPDKQVFKVDLLRDGKPKQLEVRRPRILKKASL